MRTGSYQPDSNEYEKDISSMASEPLISARLELVFSHAEKSCITENLQGGVAIQHNPILHLKFCNIMAGVKPFTQVFKGIRQSPIN